MACAHGPIPQPDRQDTFVTTLPVTLDRSSPTPLGLQLAAGVREQVLAGTLRRGDRLPSSRALAADLGVSRSVAEQAYDQLLAEGWLEARRGSGTYVASGGLAPVPTAAPRAGPEPRRLVRLDTGTPWIDPRHAAGWRRAWRDVSAATPPRGYDDPRGLPELRERPRRAPRPHPRPALLARRDRGDRRHHRRAAAPARRPPAGPGRDRGPRLPRRGRDGPRRRPRRPRPSRARRRSPTSPAGSPPT